MTPTPTPAPAPDEPRVLSVNLAHVRPNPFKDANRTGIDKRPTDEPVQVRAPGSRDGGAGSGLVGDFIGDRSAHGGDDQAVYAYAREDLDRWAAHLGRELGNGSFGENLTTCGVDVNGARVGERWRIGDHLELQVTDPRVPCATFRGWIDRQGWLREFTLAAVPGTYLRIVSPGTIRSGDRVVVSHCPESGASVAEVFRSIMRLSDDDPSPLDV